MIEKVYQFTTESPLDGKLIERIISDENADINHVVLTTGERVPEHQSNSNVYLIIVRGALSFTLNQAPAQEYPAGSIVNVPYDTHMNLVNAGSQTVEFFIVKAPNPSHFQQ